MGTILLLVVVFGLPIALIAGIWIGYDAGQNATAQNLEPDPWR